MLICVEGLTNSGKTTFCKSLSSQNQVIFINNLLQNDIVTENIAKVTHPIENSEKFNETTELLLYASMLSQKAYWIKQFNNDNRILLIDRFSLSVFARFCNSRNLNRDFLRELVNFSSDYITPDYTFFLDSSLKVIIERTSSSPFSRKDISLPDQYENLRNAYLNNITEFTKKYYIIESNSDIAIQNLVIEVSKMINQDT